MSQRASSSKTAVVAGILAGLLAAALSGYYYYEQHYEHRPAKAPRADAPPPPALNVDQPSNTANAGARSQQQAINDLLELPELKAWSTYIEKASGGKSHGAVLDYGEPAQLIDGKTYYQLSFVENTPEAAHRWESFLVARDSKEILVEDVASDETLSLARWRKEKQPLRRIGTQAAQP